MTSKRKPTVVWFQAITCNGNTHSLLSANASRLELFFDSFNLIYHPSLTIEKTLDDILTQNEKIDFLLIEGAISSNEKFFSISNDSTFNLLNKLAFKAKHIIAVGSCASNGGIHAKFTQNDDICGISDSIDEQTINKLRT
ncbi:MAG: hypothetical protein U5K55_07935 [Aliarcobacter sp.]|nr:hypothetical protein [Aliarcobacter sp.]